MKKKKNKYLIKTLFSVVLIPATVLCMCSCSAQNEEIKVKMQALYGENRIIDGNYDETLAVRCGSGTFVGVKNGDVVSYKGIPYAEAPVGELRWKPPVDAMDSNTVREAYYFGPSPVQTEWPSEVGSYYPRSEDCLTLNIWTNRSGPSSGKSVMVFFHGGSYGWGAVSDPIYDGHNLIEKYDDVILVTVEYRLGIFGFIDFSSVPGGEAYAESGNLGLLDQVCALRWIRKNIAAFGGDPDNVTVFGESAGAGSVSLLPLIDGTEGLFRRAIAESGKPVFVFSHQPCDYAVNENGVEDGRLTDLFAAYNVEHDLFSFVGHTHMPMYLFWSFHTSDGFPETYLPRLTSLSGDDDEVNDNSGVGVEVEIYDKEVVIRARNFYAGEWRYDDSDEAMCEVTYQLKNPLHADRPET